MNVIHGSVLKITSSLLLKVKKNMTTTLRHTINEYFRYLFAKPSIARQLPHMTIPI